MVKKEKHCLCDLGKECPCDEFLDSNKCACGVYADCEEEEDEIED